MLERCLEKKCAKYTHFPPSSPNSKGEGYSHVYLKTKPKDLPSWFSPLPVAQLVLMHTTLDTSGVPSSSEMHFLKLAYG